MLDSSSESARLFDKFAELTRGELVALCVEAYAELLAANICILTDSRDQALVHFRDLRLDIEQTIVERFAHYRNALPVEPDEPQTDLFGAAPVAADEEEEPAEPLPALPNEPTAPLPGWPRARMLCDAANYFASCQDRYSGELVAIGSIYPWMRDLVVECLRAEFASLSEEVAAKWEERMLVIDEHPTASGHG